MGEKISEQKIEYPQFDSITSKHSIKSISSNNITLSFGTRSTMPSCEVKLKKTDELLFTIDIEDNEKKAPIVFIKKNIVILDKEIEINPIFDIESRLDELCDECYLKRHDGFCAKCHGKLVKDANYCTHCGNKI